MPRIKDPNRNRKLNEQVKLLLSLGINYELCYDKEIYDRRKCQK
jgi:hypothetical protein